MPVCDRASAAHGRVSGGRRCNVDAGGSSEGRALPVDLAQDVLPFVSHVGAASWQGLCHVRVLRFRGSPTVDGSQRCERAADQAAAVRMIRPLTRKRS